MRELSAITAFAALSFVLIFIPGPSVMFVVSRAVALGRRAALVTVVGNAAGVYVQLLLVAAGLGAIVGRSIALFAAIKFAGALYLAWLGIQAIRHRAHLGDALDGTTAGGSGWTVFIEGFIVGIANPKAIVFFAAILPRFVAPGGAPAGVQMAALGDHLRPDRFGVRQPLGCDCRHRSAVVGPITETPRMTRSGWRCRHDPAWRPVGSVRSQGLSPAFRLRGVRQPNRHTRWRFSQDTDQP